MTTVDRLVRQCERGVWEDAAELLAVWGGRLTADERAEVERRAAAWFRQDD